MNNPAVPQATNHGPSHLSGAANGTESADKNCSRFMPRNPLISLDSDERIQGNPRKSNPHDRGSSQRNSDEPRKPKWIDQAMSQPGGREAAEQAPSTGKRPKAPARGESRRIFVTRALDLITLNL
jgi:hypothetical protein